MTDESYPVESMASGAVARMNIMTVREFASIVREIEDVVAGRVPNADVLMGKRSLTLGCPHRTIRIAAGESLYRARICPKGTVFVHPSQLWHPPAEEVRLGRANREGSPVLYVSSDGRCALSEVSPGQGDLVVVIRYQTERELTCPTFGLLEHPQFANVIQGLREAIAHAGLSIHGGHNVILIHRLLGELFALPPGEASAIYDLSARIAEEMFAPEGVDGLAYRSVAFPLDFNLALKPKSAAVALRPTAADGMLVQQYAREEKGRRIGFAHVLAARRFGPEGVLEWEDARGSGGPAWKSVEQRVLVSQGTAPESVVRAAL